MEDRHAWATCTASKARYAEYDYKVSPAPDSVTGRDKPFHADEKILSTDDFNCSRLKALSPICNASKPSSRNPQLVGKMSTFKMEEYFVPGPQE
jgi:hypothetical protein